MNSKLRFHKAQSGSQPYRIEIDTYQWLFQSDDMENWCNETLGAHTKGYNNPRWRRSYKHFHFKNEKDAMFFMLRWS
jgi:hypothetical protein